MKKIVSTFFLFGLLGASYLFGQAQDGNILGAVLDPSGSAIPGATVELENVATGVKVTSKSDKSGRFNNVLIGTYSITVNAGGFTATSLRNVIAELNKVTTANITLQVGNVHHGQRHRGGDTDRYSKRQPKTELNMPDSCQTVNASIRES